MQGLICIHSMSRILRCQWKIQTSTKVCILSDIILPTLLYGLESTVLLEPHVRCLESFVIHCLWIILGVSVREKKHHTTMYKIAKQPRISSILLQHVFIFSGTFQGRPKTDYLGSFLCVTLLVASILMEDRSYGGMTLWPVT